MYAHALTCRRIKDGPVSPLSVRRARRSVRPRVSSVQPELLPAFLMSDRKRAACVIYAKDFSPVAPAAPYSCAHCTYRCRTDRVVSRLYRRAVPVSVVSPSTWRPEENLRLAYVYRGQGTRTVPRQCYLPVPIL